VIFLFKKGYFIIIIFLIIIIIPLLVIKGFFYHKETPIIIKVYNYKTDKIVPMELDKYLKGVVAAEMPAAYHVEALKAQSVASRTYTLKKLPAFGGNGCNQPGADISTDYHYDQAWYSEKEMKDKWGFLSYFYYWARISRAVEETSGEVAVYDNRLIDSVYHSNSGGRTEDAGVVWGKTLPYLCSVDSPYDKNYGKNYKHVKEIPLERINEIMGININIEGNNIEKELYVLKYSNTGRVLTIQFGEKTFSGEEVRKKLKLPSTKFELNIEGQNIIFTIVGNGHGVGMSQDGADGFAKEGYNYKQILKYYYRGVDIVGIDKIKK